MVAELPATCRTLRPTRSGTLHELQQFLRLLEQRRMVIIQCQYITVVDHECNTNDSFVIRLERSERQSTMDVVDRLLLREVLIGPDGAMILSTSKKCVKLAFISDASVECIFRICLFQSMKQVCRQNRNRRSRTRRTVRMMETTSDAMEPKPIPGMSMTKKNVKSPIRYGLQNIRHSTTTKGNRMKAKIEQTTTLTSMNRERRAVKE